MAFGQMKELYKLQKEARKMQKEMKKLSVEGYSKDEKVRIVLNGLQEIEDIEIDESLLSAGNARILVNAIKEAHRDASKEVQKEMAKGMDLDKMKSMLGGA
jgi:DNA-binding YbaB/EbfC family protein